jgi:hypothetical protein
MRGGKTERKRTRRKRTGGGGELRRAQNWPLEAPNSKSEWHAEDETRKAEKITYISLQSATLGH